MKRFSMLKSGFQYIKKLWEVPKHFVKVWNIIEVNSSIRQRCPHTSLDCQIVPSSRKFIDDYSGHLLGFLELLCFSKLIYLSLCYHLVIDNNNGRLSSSLGFVHQVSQETLMESNVTPILSLWTRIDDACQFILPINMRVQRRECPCGVKSTPY